VRRKGIALVATLAVVAVIAVLVFGTFFTTQLEIWTTRNDVTANQAYAVAQAGIQKYKTLAFQAFRYYLNNINAYGSELARYAQCGNLLTIGLDSTGTDTAHIAISYKPAHSWQNNFGIVAFGV